MSRKNVLVRWLAVAALVLMAVLATISCANEPKVYTLVIKSDGEPTFRQDLVETSPWMLEEKTRLGYELESITDQHGHEYQPLDIIRINENLTITYNWLKGGFVIRSVEGGLEIKEYKGKQSEVVIPDNIDGVTVKSIGNSAFKNCTGLTSITIPDSVTKVDSRAFSGCSGLESITLGKGVTSLSGFDFHHYENLTSIKVARDNPVFYSSGNCLIVKEDILHHRGGDLLAGCPNSVIPTNGIVKRIVDYAFSNCVDTISLIIPADVYICSEAFDGCGDVDLTFAEGTTKINNIGCDGTVNGYVSVSIPSTVTNLGHCFQKCFTIEIDPGNTVYRSEGSCVIRREDNVLVAGCSNSTIPSGVTSIGYAAFSGCASLDSITIPDSVTKVGDYAFEECTGLTEITIPDSVTCIGEYAFYHCTSLTSMDIPDSVTSIGDYAFYGCEALTSIDIPDGVGSIEYRAFQGCKSLTSITIPDSVTSIGDEAFYGCTGLTSIDIPDSVTSIGDEAFYGCTGLTSIDIPDSVTKVGDCAFEECTGLTSITIPDSVTSIGRFAFSGCTGLTSVTIPESVTNIGVGAFARCSNLESISVDPNNTVYLSSGDCLYDKEGNLVLALNKSSIHIPDGVQSIGNFAFYGCEALTSMKIGNGVTNIGGDAFRDCTGLTSITIPSSVTSIGGQAFYGCTGLTSITIPSSVTSVGYGAFEGWTSSQTINIDKTEAEVDAQWHGSWNYNCYRATIIYKDSPAN